MYRAQVSIKPFNPKRPGALVGVMVNVSEYLGALYGSIAEMRGAGPYSPCAECSESVGPANIDPSRMIASELSLKNGAVLLWAGTNCAPVQRIRQLSTMLGIDYQRPLEEQDQQFISILLYGYDKEPVSFVYNKRPRIDYYRGCVSDIQFMIDARTTGQGNRRMISFFSQQTECPACWGTKLSKDIMDIDINGLTLAETAKLPIPELLSFIQSLSQSMDAHGNEIAGPIISNLMPMLHFLRKIGLRRLPQVSVQGILS
ncbi:hypothetical protein ACP26L_07860 [Paenibacillus sp. S-38]|uniref:hypothetical protein n=1 Tax=Paenibacillus sp. S-38 TaxID=3416710 RepID=UPI003CE838AB